jgi:CheY-like chemotaxis protein
MQMQKNTQTPAHSELPKPHASIKEGKEGPCILLMDDEEMMRRIFSRFLERAGYIVDVAENGKIGLDSFDPKRHALVISDGSMPVMSGWEAIPKIKEKSPNTPIIIISGDANVGEIPEKKRVTEMVDNYLIKPVERQTLIDAVAKLAPIKV